MSANGYNDNIPLSKEGEKLDKENSKKEDAIMESVERLETKVDSIDGRLRQVEICAGKGNVLTEQSIKSYDKLSETLDKMGDTLGEINNNMFTLSARLDDTNKSMVELKSELKCEVSQVDNKVESVDGRVSAIEDSQTIKINWVQLIKTNITRIILGILSASGVGWILSLFVDKIK